MKSESWIKRFRNFITRGILLIGITTTIVLIALMQSCETSKNAEISYVPESERVFFVYQDDRVTDPNGNMRFTLPYDGMIVSSVEYFRMAEK